MSTIESVSLLALSRVSLLGLTVMSFAGCGGASASGTAAATSRAPVFEGTPVTSIELPAGDTEGRPIEPRTLLDAPHLKLLAIVLRDGTVLPEHTAPTAVTIQAVSGSGVVRANGETHPLDAMHFISLAPRVAHSIEPAAGTDMVLLVHHLKATEEGVAR